MCSPFVATSRSAVISIIFDEQGIPGNEVLGGYTQREADVFRWDGYSFLILLMTEAQEPPGSLCF